MELFEWLEAIDSKNDSELIAYLMDERLIKDNMSCLHCEFGMILTPESNSILGSTWRCFNKTCEFYETQRSLLSESFFFNSKIHPKKQLKTIYYLIKKTKYDDISDNVGGLNRKFIIKVKEKLCEKIKEYFEQNPVRLGGPNRIVQIDETKLNFNVKSHRGRSVQSPDWALTMADTSVTPARSFATMVPERSANVMLPIIENVVRSNSVIYSDEWAAYKGLAELNLYSHGTIAHKYHFVDPLTGVHTQHVESLNNKIKFDIKNQKGVRRTNRERFLKLFMFIDHFKKEAFFKILELIRAQ